MKKMIMKIVAILALNVFTALLGYVVFGVAFYALQLSQLLSVLLAVLVVHNLSFGIMLSEFRKHPTDESNKARWLPKGNNIIRRAVHLIKHSKLSLFINCLWVGGFTALLCAYGLTHDPENFYIVFPIVLVCILVPSMAAWSVADEYFESTIEMPKQPITDHPLQLPAASEPGIEP